MLRDRYVYTPTKIVQLYRNKDTKHVQAIWKVNY